MTGQNENSIAQLELDEFRRTGRAYYNPADEVFMWGSSEIKNDWSTVERAPAGTTQGGQWIGKKVTTERSATKAMTEYKKDLSNDAMDAVAEYTGSDYYETNRSLRDGENPILIDRLEAQKKELDKVLEDAPKFEGIVYRGIQFNSLNGNYEKFIAGINSGNVYSDKAFLSTTTKPDIADEFTINAEHFILFKIKSKNGVFLNGLSADEREKEVLLKRNSKFKVVTVTKISGSGKSKAEGSIIEMEEL